MTNNGSVILTTWLVTGCSRGLGLGFVRTLSRDHRNIIIATCRDPASAHALNAVAKESQLAGKVHVVRLDIEDENSIKEAVVEAEKILTAKGLGLDYLLNNAGVLHDDHVFPFNLENFTKVMRTNVAGPALVTAAVLPLLRKSRRRVVMNMSSTLASFGSDIGPKCGTYSASKVALNMITYKQAKEAPDLIPVAVCPGWVKTDMGGSQALVEVEDSISRIIDLLKRLKADDAGTFFNYQGQQLPW